MNVTKSVTKEPESPLFFAAIINIFLSLCLCLFFIPYSSAHHNFTHTEASSETQSSDTQPITVPLISSSTPAEEYEAVMDSADVFSNSTNDIDNSPNGLDGVTTEAKDTSTQPKTSKQIQNKNIFSDKELAWIQQNPIVTYGALTSWFPHDFIDEFGKHQGIAKDYLSVVSEKTGLQFRPTSATWSELLEKTERGEIDLLPALHKNERRKEFMVFSRPYSQTNYLMFSKKSFKANDNLQKQKIALIKNYAINEKIQKKFPLATYTAVDSFHEAIKKLLNNEVDLIVDAYGAIHYYLKNNNIKDVVPFQPYDTVFDEFVYMGVPKKNATLVSIINKAIAEMTDAEKKRIYNRWSTYFINEQYPNSYSLDFTPAEKEWLKDHPVISFVGSQNWKPYEYYDSTDVLKGINIDLVNLIDGVLPVRFDYIHPKTHQNKLQTQNDTIYFSSSLSIKDEDYGQYDYSESLYSFPVVIAMKNDYPFVEHIEELQGKKVAVVTQLLQSLELENMYPMLDFYPVESINDGVLAVSTGQYDAFLDSTAGIAYELNELSISNVRIVGKTDLKIETRFAVPKGNEVFLGILNKAIVGLSQTQRSKALAKWGQENFKTKVDYRLVYIILGTGGILLILGWYGNRSLAKQVDLRNEEIEKRKASEQNLFKVNQRLELANLTAKLGSWEITFPKNDEGGSADKSSYQHQSIRELSDTLVVRDEWIISDNIKNNDDEMFFTLDQWTKNIENKEIVLDIIEDVRISKGTAEVEVTLLDDPKKYDNPHDAVRTLYSHLAYHNIDGVEKIIGTKQDITSIKKTERALIIASKRAEDANKAKSEFLANMSHEIRTPLNVIMGYTMLLTERITDESHQKILRTVNSAGKHLLVLINDILDLSKIEAGKFQVVFIQSNIHNLLQDVANIFTLRLQQKGLELELILDNAIPANLSLDEVRVRQILVNLIGNAIKFTHEGKITIELSLLDITNQKDKLDLAISVTDTGIGMTEEVIARIFGKFEQADTHAARGYEGAGLGLAISKQLAEMMNGSLTARSKKDEGSVFTLTLKGVNILGVYKENKQPVHKQYSLLDESSANVLVVSNIQENLEQIQAILLELPMVLSLVDDMKSAVNLIQEKLDMRIFFDLILVDIDFGKENKFQTSVDELLENIKTIKHIYGVPVLVLSDVSTEIFDKSIYKYIEGFITKPFSYETVYAEVTKHLQLSSQPAVELSEFALNKQISVDTSTQPVIPNTDNTTNNTETDAESNDQKYQAMHVYRELVGLKPMLDNLLITNDLSGTKHFVILLQELHQNYPMTVLKDYTTTLQTNISSLDLIGIRNSLNDFAELIHQVKNFS